uniref:Uncharacterized protein n=1 Tax=Arundo donax TaxID=35708 RepID=A0A0A9ELG9_ARUDO
MTDLSSASLRSLADATTRRSRRKAIPFGSLQF